MFKYIRIFIFFLCIYSPPFFNLPSYFVYSLVLFCFFAYDFLSHKLSFHFYYSYSWFFVGLVLLIFICLYYNVFYLGFQDVTSLFFSFVILFSFLSPSFSTFFKHILHPSHRLILFKGFFLFSLFLSIPSVLQFLRLDYGVLDFAYNSDMLLVKTSAYRFPGIMNMYGAIASTVYSTFITFFLFITRSSPESFYSRVTYFIAIPLLLFSLLFSGSTGLFLLSLFFLIFNLRFFIISLLAGILSSQILLNIPIIANTSLSYVLKILSFDPNINLFTEGSLGFMLTMYFSDESVYRDFITTIPLLGGLSTFYTSVGTDVGFFNLIGIYSIFSVILFYFLILFFVYSLRNSPYFSLAIYLLITCILINFKEVYFLSSPGPFRLMLILCLANLPLKVSSFSNSSLSIHNVQLPTSKI